MEKRPIGTTSAPVTTSPEIFLPDDQIVNTQGSVASGEEIRSQEVTDGEIQDQAAERDISLIDTEAQPHERRRSERLKKDITMTTQEKNDFMAKKRNLEGNTIPKSMFSELSHDSLHDISKKWGLLLKMIRLTLLIC
jgi:hypothetical protein